MIKATQEADDTPEVIDIRVATYPRWNGKPLQQRLEALRILLKHSGFRPLSITREGNPGGE
ncbi:MAG: hypothetical protein KF777_00225 [Planctomycetaceae bacterium]|nr:hypothetical protein [Planctomycetaceae bacterium]